MLWRAAAPSSAPGRRACSSEADGRLRRRRFDVARSVRGDSAAALAARAVPRQPAVGDLPRKRRRRTPRGAAERGHRRRRHRRLRAQEPASRTSSAMWGPRPWRTRAAGSLRGQGRGVARRRRRPGPRVRPHLRRHRRGERDLALPLPPPARRGSRSAATWASMARAAPRSCWTRWRSALTGLWATWAGHSNSSRRPRERASSLFAPRVWAPWMSSRT